MYTIKISWECYSSFCESSGITNHTTNNFVFHIVGNYRKVVTLFILEVASAIAVKLYVHTQKSMEVVNTEAGLENSESINSDHACACTANATLSTGDFHSPNTQCI